MNTSAPTVWLKKRKITADGLLYYAFAGAFFCMPLGTAPQNITGACAALIWLFSGRCLRVKEFYKNSWFWPVLLYIVLPWIGLLYTLDQTDLGLDYAKKTHYFIYCLAIASIAFSRYSGQRLIQAFLAGLGINSVIAVFQVIGLVPAMGHGRFHGLGLEYNTLSALLVVGILMASYYFKMIKEKRPRVLIFLLLALYFFHLIMLRGRNGYFTIFLLSPLVIQNLFSEINKFKLALICLMIPGLMYLSPVVRREVDKSINQVKSHLNEAPGTSWGKKHSRHEERLYISRSAIDIFIENPLLGVGTGGYRTFTEKRGKPIDHPHNNFLYMAVSFGILGVISLIWIFWEVIKNSYQQRHTPIGFFVFSSTLTIFISGIFNSQIIDAGTAFLFAVIIGLQQQFSKFSEST